MNELNVIQNCITSVVNTTSNYLMFYGRYAFKDGFPVFLRGTGDKVYLSKDEGLNEAEEYLIERVPSCKMSIKSVKYPESKRSLGRQDSQYKISVHGTSSKKTRPMKVMGYEIELDVLFTLPDSLKVMQFIQYLQEAFTSTTIPISFDSDGMMNEALMFIDISNLDIDFKIGNGDEYEDMYPTIRTSITVLGNYANFGFYDLRSGGHGYSTSSKGSETDFLNNNDLDVKNVIKGVTVITKVSDADGNSSTDSFTVK